MGKKLVLLVVGILAVAIVGATGSYLSKETANVAQASSGLEIEEWQWEDNPVLKYIKINGIVKNNSNRTYEHVKMFVSAYDSNGNWLGADWARLEPTTFLPGQPSIFTVCIHDAICQTRTLEIKYQFITPPLP